MTLHRFYLDPAHWDPAHLVLDETESRHASEVLRLRPGDLLSVFNGQGQEIHARLAEQGKRRSLLTAESIHSSPPPSRPLLLAPAIPKGKHMDFVLQKATELGVTAIFPLLTERTVVRLDPSEAADKQDKWQRLVIEACKQCGQNHLPKVHLPQSFAAFLAALPPSDLRLLAALTPDARPLHALLPPAPPASALLLIGPEGDFSPAELAAARAAHFQSLSLGPLILRAETAAIAALALAAYELRRGDS